MRIVSPLLKNVVYPLLSRSGLLRRYSSAEPAVVTYHGVLPAGYHPRSIALDGHLVTIDMLRRQLQMLRSRYNVISPAEFRAWTKGEVNVPPRSVLLTCDDGLINVLTDMLPILRELGLPCLFFVTAGKALDHASMLWHEKIHLWLSQCTQGSAIRIPGDGHISMLGGKAQKQHVWRELIASLSEVGSDQREVFLRDLRIQLGIGDNWESEYSQDEALRRRFFLLQRQEIRALGDAVATIGAHTLSHPLLSRMPEQFAMQEIAESRARLEQVTGQKIWAMAYPFGNAQSVSARDVALAEIAGYECAFMNTQYARRANLFAFPRIHVSMGMSVAELDAYVSGFYQQIRELYCREQFACAAPKQEIEHRSSKCA